MSKPTSITAKKSDGGQKAFKAPNPIIIIACIILVSALASYFVPAGLFDRIEDPGTGRMVVDPSTFHYIAKVPSACLTCSNRLRWESRAEAALSPSSLSSAAPLVLWKLPEQLSQAWPPSSERCRAGNFFWFPSV